MKNNKLKFLIVVLVFFLQLFFVKYNDTFAIYKSNLSTPISLSVLDPASNFAVTLHANDGTNNTTTVYRTYNQALGNVLPSARTDYNFTGWYDSNGNRIYSSDAITGAIDLYAHWQKIVCKKATVLHTETCYSGGGCALSGTGFNTTTDKIITYGTTYGLNSPTAGDAYDCDVNYDGTYDLQGSNGKYTERFYFLKEYEHNNAEDTATLIYYTSFDANGTVDSQNTPKDDIGSDVYDTALTWLPTSSTWSNPTLTNFNNNGKVTRFITLDEIEATCGTLATPFPNPPATIESTSYFTTCQKWFLFENSRFQDNDLGRSGIWIEMEDSQHYRIQAGSVVLASVAASSQNMARPVIEIPLSAFEGYVAADRYTIDFETYGGTPVSSIRRYSGEEIGTIETTTRDHFTFDGWYANYSNGTYSTPVTPSTIVTGPMTLHAKWTAKPTCEVTLNLNGGTGLTSPVIVDIGELYEPGTPTKPDSTFDGWYTDPECNTPYDSTVAISTSTLTLYANWTSANYVATVEGVGSYETLAEAISNVPTGSVKTRVTLLKDVTLDTAVTIPSNKWVEFDAYTHTLSGAVNLFTNNGKLDIIGGTLISTDSYLINNGANSTLNISGGSLTISNSNSEARVINNNVASAITNISGGALENTATGAGNIIENIGTVNITGGTLTNNAQGAAINVKSNGKLNVSGGVIEGKNATKGQGIYMDGSCQVNISGNAYIKNVSTSSGNNKRAAIDVNNGTLVVTGGTIVSDQYIAVETRTNNTSSATIGEDDNNIDITTPVLRGKIYGLQRTKGTVSVYDGLFESLNNTRAVNGTITKPCDFEDSTTTVGSDTYHTTYLRPSSYPVTFYASDGETVLDTRQVPNGSSITASSLTMPTNPTDSNYVFAGWYINGDSTTPFTASTTVTGNIRAIAMMKEKITYATLSKTPNINPYKIVVGNTGTITLTPTTLGDAIEDYTITSGNTNFVTIGQRTGNTTEINAVGVGSTNITISGGLSNDPIIISVTVDVLKHTVTFKDGNDIVDTIEVEHGTQIGAQMLGSQTKTYYLFDGWFIDGDREDPCSSTTRVDDDMDVFAGWTPSIQLATIPSTYTISLGGTNTIPITDIPTGMESYTFSSSNSTIASVNQTTGEITGVNLGTTNIVITGSRSGISRNVSVTVANATCTVTFRNDDNSLITEVPVAEGSSLGGSMPPDQSETNYIFKGWYINGESTTPFTSSTQVNSSITVIASWRLELNSATVVKSPDPLSFKIGKTGEITLIDSTNNNRLVENCSFASSNTSIAGITYSNNVATITGLDFGNTTISITGSDSNQVIQVPVTIHNYNNITFDPDNGNPNDITSIQLIDGASIGSNVPSNPTYSGYTFDTWYLYDETNEVLTPTPINASESITNDRIYKARWAGSNDVAAIGTTYYPTLQDAINAVQGSETAEIRVLKNISNPSGRTYVSDKKDITINANGYQISCGNSTTGNLLWANGGTLRLKNGTFTCNQSGLATLETASTSSSRIYIESGTTVTNTGDRSAIYNNGKLYISDGSTISSNASIRSTIANKGPNSLVEMSGGSVLQDVASTSDKGAGAIKVEEGTVIIKGGTVTSNSTNTAAIDKTNGGSLTIGTDHNNNTYDATNPVIQGEQYGVYATSNYSVYDGIIKGKTAAVNDETKIDGIEIGTTKQNGTDGGYYTLYYIMSSNPSPTPTPSSTPTSYTITFASEGGEVSPTNAIINYGDPITSSDLPTATWTNKTFAGWYLDENYTNAVVLGTTTPNENTTLYAKWTYTPANPKVSYNAIGDAMGVYFNNISTWKNLDKSTFQTTMKNNFDNYSCSSCGEENKCTSPGAGTYCDRPKSYDTNTNSKLDVYLYDETNHVIGKKVLYANATNGTIINLIPGQTYYWEKNSDPSVNGLIESTTPRRTIYAGSVRNVRDLGGMNVDTDNNGTVDGTIKYGRLFRGAKLSSSQSDVTALINLGITREIDVRADSEGNNQARLPVVDNGSGGQDIVIENYLINHTAYTYSYTHGSNSYTSVPEHSSNASALKSALKATMQYIIAGDNIYFHCTIGTDRTGTLAYFLEGLLGVSEEDRVEDYELTYFFGLVVDLGARDRYHDDLTSTSIYPRFKFMHTAYPTNQAIYSWFVEGDDATELAADNQLIANFRNAMIDFN